MLNLTQKPYLLTTKTSRKYPTTRLRNDNRRKIGQLFFCIGQDEERVSLDDFIWTPINQGGLMFRPGPAAQISRQIKQIQHHSKFPLFLCES